MQKKAASAIKKVAVKKPAAKKIVKKVATPKKKSSKKVLTYSDNEHSFWVSDGQILNSLLALSEAVSAMEKSTFAHHVGKDKHDFADWVDSVLCDAECAAELRKAKTQNTVKTVIAKHLQTYKV